MPSSRNGSRNGVPSSRNGSRNGVPAGMAAGMGCQAAGMGCQAAGMGCQAAGMGCQAAGMPHGVASSRNGVPSSLPHRLFFVGALACADNLVLLAPSAKAMRCMLRICEEYAAQFKVVFNFNASKSKCLCCHPNGTTKHATQAASLCIPSFMIGSQLIEFVGKWPHLGNIITNDCIDTDDILAKKSYWTNQ